MNIPLLAQSVEELVDAFTRGKRRIRILSLFPTPKREKLLGILPVPWVLLEAGGQLLLPGKAAGEKLCFWAWRWTTIGSRLWSSHGTCQTCLAQAKISLTAFGVAQVSLGFDAFLQ
uniref:Uncharacterized protein n=1 Tax=Sphaerodactylus townsendi TaxID=933632 RepID=A0ACB8FU75_9SAUR